MAQWLKSGVVSWVYLLDSLADTFAQIFFGEIALHKCFMPSSRSSVNHFWNNEILVVFKRHAVSLIKMRTFRCLTILNRFQRIYLIQDALASNAPTSLKTQVLSLEYTSNSLLYVCFQQVLISPFQRYPFSTPYVLVSPNILFVKLRKWISAFKDDITAARPGSI